MAKQTGNDPNRNEDEPSAPSTLTETPSVIGGAKLDPKLRHWFSEFIKSHMNHKELTYTDEQIETVLDSAREAFKEQPMLIKVHAPVSIVGDIHGQFRDLKRLFQLGFGKPPATIFLFLGDYVDRGKYNLETIMLLLALKVRHRKQFFLLRGNHECQNINRVYGFFDELERRHHLTWFPVFNDVFNYMPLAAMVGHKLLCMHGGISRQLKSLDQINSLERPLTMRDRNPLALDLMWADPEKDETGFVKSTRGAAYSFGMDACETFCVQHHLDLIVRAHQVVQHGFDRMHGPSGKIRLVTIFSAPNYCGEMDYNAALMQVSKDYHISFKVLEPNQDKEARDCRNKQRATVPAFDEFVDDHGEFDMKQLLKKTTDTFSQMGNKVKHFTNTARKK